MGLRRQAREFAEEPVDTRKSLPVRITPTGRIAEPAGETVQPGTKFKPFDRRDIFLPTVGGRIVKRGPKEPSINIIPKMVVSSNRRSPVASAPVVRPSPVPQKEPAISVNQKRGREMGLDLGNLLSTGLDLYGRYMDIKNPIPTAIAAPAAVVASPVAQTYWPEGYGVQQMAGPQFIANTPGSGIDNPFGELISQPPDEALAAGMKGWAYKKSCGEWKWVKSGRRRRRVILTDSDYNGLLKLQTLKVNSNMNIAIAKAIGR